MRLILSSLALASAALSILSVVSLSARIGLKDPNVSHISEQFFYKIGNFAFYPHAHAQVQSNPTRTLTLFIHSNSPIHYPMNTQICSHQDDLP